MGKRKTTEQFVKEAQLIHGLRYDYEDVEYVNGATPVLIRCPSHGIFLQSPTNHLQGQRCSKCAKKAIADKLRSTKEEFVKKAKTVHGLRYDYTKVEYLNTDSKVIILCSTHGEFYQSPYNHLIGKGCRQCANILRANKEKLTKKEFIEKAQSIHGSFYGYSDVEYVNYLTKVLVNCPIHGGFWVTPANHLKKRGCNKCGRISQINKRKLTNEQFIKKAQSIHGTLYKYDRVEYVNSNTPVLIHCTEHGDFYQIPYNHLVGKGCSSCASYGFDRQKPAILYFLEFEKPLAKFYKIGVTNRTVEDRFGKEDYDCIKTQTVWRFSMGCDASTVEKLVLNEFSKYKLDGFLFDILKLGGETECFTGKSPKKEIIQFINKQVKEMKHNRDISKKDIPNYTQLTLPH